VRGVGETTQNSQDLRTQCRTIILYHSRLFKIPTWSKCEAFPTQNLSSNSFLKEKQNPSIDEKIITLEKATKLDKCVPSSCL
jgi:hypothetical protein